MSYCTLCTDELAPSELYRFSGIDLCSHCRDLDPAANLSRQGSPVEWKLVLGRFCAGSSLGTAANPDFRLKCVPQLLRHTIVKMVVPEVEVGDPVFDDRIYVRTSDPKQAVALLAPEGVQSAILNLLSDVLHREIACNYISINGQSLSIVVRPLRDLDADLVQEFKLETAALTLQLRAVWEQGSG